jgi:hypothetical protein
MELQAQEDLVQAFRTYYHQFHNQFHILSTIGHEPFLWGQYVTDLEQFGQLVNEVVPHSSLQSSQFLSLT